MEQHLNVLVGADLERVASEVERSCSPVLRAAPRPDLDGDGHTVARGVGVLAAGQC